MDYQQLLVEHLDLIDQIVRTMGRRRHLSAEQEEFTGFVRLRLIENDYAVLRKFQHRSSWRTYLAAVIERLSLDFCVERWGRWRPSAVADRLGPVAVLLERLVTRDGYTLDEALEIVQTSQSSGLSVRELRDLWGQVPARLKTSEVGEQAAATVPSPETSGSRVDDAEHRMSVERLARTLQSAIAALPDQDRVLLTLRYRHDLSIAQIARTSGLSVPTLHRRLDRTIKELKRALTNSGVAPGEAIGLIGHPTIALPPLLRAEAEGLGGPVRLPNQDG